MILEIKVFPDPILREKTVEVKPEELNAEFHTLLDNMRDTMYDAPGIGLAAPQIGRAQRFFIIDTTGGEEPEALMEFINPEFLVREGEIIAEEGCLSIPGEYANVKRFENVTIKAMNRYGEWFEVEAEGLLARAIQHEYDHLEGVLFIDRLSTVKREIVKKAIKRRIKAGEYAPTGV